MKILIIKLSAIGDVVMSLSMIDALQKYYGDDVHITWITGKVVSPILNEIKSIDKVITLNEKNIFSQSKLTQVLEIVKVWRNLFFSKFDKVIIAHNDWKYRILSIFTLSSTKVAFGVGKNKKLPLGTRYHGIDYVELATNQNFLKNYKLKYPNFLKNIQKNTSLNNKVKKILLFPGGANNLLNEQYLKRWNINNYSSLAKQLIYQNYKVAIAGANTDNWTSKYFNKDVKNYIGKTNLLETIELIMEYDLVVTHDSGPLHLSLLLANKKAIALFGATPYSSFSGKGILSNSIVLTSNKELSCMPCYDGKNFAKCEDNVCMQNISVEDVYNKVIEELKVKK